MYYICGDTNFFYGRARSDTLPRKAIFCFDRLTVLILQDDEARYVDAQRGLPRPRVEAPESVPIQPVGVAQGYGGQPMYAEAARFDLYWLLLLEQ